MLRIRRAPLLAALALAALGVAAGPAAAAISGLSIEGGSISDASAGKLRFTGGAFSVACDLTMTGTLVRGLVAPEADIGGLTGGRFAECAGGSASWVATVSPIIVKGYLEWPVGIPICGLLVPYTNATPNVIVCGRLIVYKSIVADFTLERLNCRYELTFPRHPLTILRIRTPGRAEDRFIAGEGTIAEGTMQFVRGSLTCPATLTVSGSFAPLSPTQTITML